MPLPLTVSCFSKIQIGFTFLVPAHPGSPGKRAVKRVCVCVVYLIAELATLNTQDDRELLIRPISPVPLAFHCRGLALLYRPLVL